MDKQKIEMLINQDFTIKQIGEEIGKSESAVRRLLKKHNLKTHRHNNHDLNATHRKCRYCGETKFIENFAVANQKNEVEIYRRWRCIKCYSDLKKNRIYTLKDFLNDYKKTKCCERCGNKDFRILQFHHCEGDKKFNVSDGPRKGFSKERILEEIKKCDIYCSNCHIILHWELRQKVV